MKYSSLPAKIGSMAKKILEKPDQHLIDETIECINQENELFNIYNKFNDDLIKEAIEKLYTGSIIENVIQCMKLCDQNANNIISTFLQSSSRESQSNIFAKYLVKHKTAFDTLLSYLNVQKLASTTHILIRSAAYSEDFASFLINNNFMSQIVQLCTYGDFEIVVCALKTFEYLFVRHNVLISKYIRDNYSTFSLQLLQILKSKKFVVLATILPFIVNMLTTDCAKQYLEKLYTDRLFFITILKFIGNRHTKIRMPAYGIFKTMLFRYNVSDEFKAVVRKNSTHILAALNKVKLPDDPQIHNEHSSLVALILNF